MINLNKKHLKMALLGISIALAPALSSAAGSCGSSCLTEARACISQGNDSADCFEEYESCMYRHRCDGWS